MKIKNTLLIIMLVAASVSCIASSQQSKSEGEKSVKNTVLQRSTPAQEGVDPIAVGQFVDALMAVPQTDIHHVMVVRHGKVIAEAHPEPFHKDDVHTLYSCSKTFTMLAIGMLVDEGKLTVNDKVIDLLPDKAPKVKSPALKKMTVKHLLTMTAGIKPALELRQEGDDWARIWLAQPVTRLGRFQYDSLCTFMLAAIVQRITGKTLLEFLNERFFHPLGIYEADWEESPDGINVGGWGLRLTTESMAKAGICIMNHGKWEGKQLVSAKWIDEASLKHTNYSNPGKKATDTNQGYCYQMWRCLLPGAFRADGAYGQFIVMSPEKDLVVVITGVSHNTGKELATIWNKLIPGVKNVELTANEAAQNALEKKLTNVALPLLKGYKGAQEYTFTLGPNARNYKTMQLKFDGDMCDMTLTRTNGAEESHPFMYNGWAKQTTTHVPPYNNAVKPVNLNEVKGLVNMYTTAGNYAHTSDYTFTFCLYWTTWIVPNTFTIKMNKDLTATITNDEGYPGCEPEVINATYEISSVCSGEPPATSAPKIPNE